MFFAPEMFNAKTQKVHGENSDIWALGITFYYLLTGEYPWKATNPLQLYEEVCGQEIDFSLIKDDHARDLISKVLNKDPQKRATLNQMFEHPWITNNDS